MSKKQYQFINSARYTQYEVVSDGDSEEKNQGFSHSPNQLSDGYFLTMLHKLNTERCTKLCKLIERISANFEFSRLLSEYFTNYDILEPALILIAAALRKGPNVLKTLHGGIQCNDLSTSGISDHYKRNMRDSVVLRNKATNENNSIQRNTFSWKDSSVKLKKGYYFRFQHTNNCDDWNAFINIFVILVIVQTMTTKHVLKNKRFSKFSISFKYTLI